MTPKRSTRLLLTSAASAALAIGGLSLATGPADAATSSQTASYDCTNPTTGATVSLPATISLTDLPDTLATGVTVSDAGYSLALDSNVLSTLIGNANVAVNDLSTQVGLTPVTNATTNPLLTTLGTALSGVTGTLGSFTVPSSGDLPLPTSFDLVGTLLGLPVPTNVVGDCALAPSSTSPVTVTTSSGNTSTVTAIGKQKATIKGRQVGHTPKLQVKVKNQTGKASGSVVATLHGKKVGKGTLKNGKVTMKLKKLKKGVNRVKVAYAGDAVTNAAKKSIKVKVGAARH